MKLDDLDTAKRYIGYDKRGLPFVVAFQPAPLAWWACIGFEPQPDLDSATGLIYSLIVALREDMADFLVRVEPLP